MRKKTWATGMLIGAAAVAAMATAAAVPAASAATKPATATALKPPPVTILSDKAGNGGGDIFISPFGDSTTYANGAEILSPDGEAVELGPGDYLRYPGDVLHVFDALEPDTTGIIIMEHV